RPQNAVAAAPSRRDQTRYDTALQSDVMLALCRDAATRPGQYRAALDLWVTPSGRVDHVDLLSSTGDPGRDKRIVTALDELASMPPPPGLSQPTTLLLLPKADSAQLCESLSPATPKAAIR